MNFETELIRLIDKARREKWSVSELERQITILIEKSGMDAKTTKRIKDRVFALLEDAGFMLAGIVTHEQLQNMINYYNWKTIKTTDEFKRKLSKVFIEHKDDIDSKLLRNKVKSLVGTKQYYANTIMNTTFAGVDNLKQIATKSVEYKKKTNKEPRFKYVGPPPERAFCREHLNKTYTLSEIQNMDNGQGLPVISNGGGYNCRHQWVLVWD